MLQQTRVEAVVPFYNRFLDRFPDIESLASAHEQAVLTAWSGLGYYSRARNLHHAAKQIVQGGLPATYEQIRDLRGIGDYTAAAVGSIAFNLPHAAVDGNVLRVIARLTNDASEITALATRRRISEKATKLLDRERPGDFNQAMMELGATVCTPASPRCYECPVVTSCAAHAAGTQHQVPVKLKKQTVREIQLDLALVQRDGRIWLVKRSSAEKRLAGFWELPTKQSVPRARSKKLAEFQHQIVNDRFHITIWKMALKTESVAGEWIPISRLNDYPLTTVTKKALHLCIPAKSS